MKKEGFLSLAFVGCHEGTRSLLRDVYNGRTMKERNIGELNFIPTLERCIEDMMFLFPDIVFLDMRIGDVSWEEAVDALREEDASAYIILIGDLVTKQQVETAREKQIKGLLVFPFSVNAIDRHIQRYFKEKFASEMGVVQAIDDDGMIHKDQ